MGGKHPVFPLSLFPLSFCFTLGAGLFLPWNYLQPSLRGKCTPSVSHQSFILCLFPIVLCTVSLKIYNFDFKQGRPFKVDLEIFNTFFATSLDSELAIVHLDLFLCYKHQRAYFHCFSFEIGWHVEFYAFGLKTACSFQISFTFHVHLGTGSHLSLLL